MSIIHGASEPWRKKTSITFLADGAIAAEETYEGARSDLLSIAVEPGDSRTVESHSCVVTACKLEIGGAICSLSISSTDAWDFVETSADGTFELDWQRVDQDIRSHRAWADGGTYELTSGDWDNIKSWEAETDATAKGAKFAALSASAQQLAKRIREGKGTFPMWTPVAKRTRTNASRPTTSNVGQIDTPPAGCGAPSTTAEGNSYIYVKMADRASKTVGQPWRREEEWIGFDSVDTLLYTND